MGTIDVIAEWEESIRAQGHALKLSHPLLTLLLEENNIQIHYVSDIMIGSKQEAVNYS